MCILWRCNPRRLERQSCSGRHHTMGQPLYKVSRKYQFMFSFDSTLCKWGWIFYRELYSVTPDALTHNFFLSAGNNANPNPNLDPDLLNPKLITSTDGRGLLQCHVSIHSNQGFSFYCASIHTHTPIHTHRDKMIAISAPTSNMSVQIISISFFLNSMVFKLKADHCFQSPKPEAQLLVMRGLL